MNIVILGLSITSSWGNGHATTYRALVRQLAARGHRVLFLERDKPWYAENRDMPAADWARIELYQDPAELKARFGEKVREADLVIVGSYVPDGVPVGRWVTDTARGVAAFYDIDTPVTLAKLKARDYEYLSPDLIPSYDLYLSFTGGPVLEQLVREWGAPLARPLYCSVDPELYRPLDQPRRFDLGYMGTYSDDRQPALDRLFTCPARDWPEGRFILAGPQFPAHLVWPDNVERIEHLPPRDHCRFYNSQRFTLNITRRDMVASGHAPSVRLFEAAACGTPIISDYWQGLESFFTPGEEILISRGPGETLSCLRELAEPAAREMAAKARERVLGAHTALHRALELEAFTREALARKGP